VTEPSTAETLDLIAQTVLRLEGKIDRLTVTVDRMALDLRDLRDRMSLLEQSLALQNRRLDRLEREVADHAR